MKTIVKLQTWISWSRSFWSSWNMRFLSWFSIDSLSLFWNVWLWQKGNHNLLGQVSIHLLSVSWSCSEFFYQHFSERVWGIFKGYPWWWNTTLFSEYAGPMIFLDCLCEFNLKRPLTTHLHLPTCFLPSREDNLRHWTLCSAVVSPVRSFRCDEQTLLLRETVILL